MRDWVDTYSERLGGLLLPPRCVLCGSRGQLPCLDLCRACEESLPAARPLVMAGPAPLQRCVAPFAYETPLDHLVLALKYRGQLALGRVLGTLLGQHIAACGLGCDIDLVIPVPLHATRQAERGFNQSVEIARWTARRLDCRIEPTLVVRRRQTRPQVGLRGEQRRVNLAGAFAACAQVRGLRVAVVDDVTTTGTTLRELAQSLVDAGARSVEGWCVGRALHQKQVESKILAKGGEA